MLLWRTAERQWGMPHMREACPSSPFRHCRIGATRPVTPTNGRIVLCGGGGDEQRAGVQVSSYVYFLGVVPVLRYGPQKELFPYQSSDNRIEEFIGLIDSRLDEDMHFLDSTSFKAAMSFSCAHPPPPVVVITHDVRLHCALCVL